MIIKIIIRFRDLQESDSTVGEGLPYCTEERSEISQILISLRWNFENVDFIEVEFRKF